MLLEQLNELRQSGLVDKMVFSGYPLKTEYFLTENNGDKIIRALEVTFVIVHLDTYNHCIEKREDIREYFSPEKLEDLGADKFYIPEDNGLLEFKKKRVVEFKMLNSINF